MTTAIHESDWLVAVRCLWGDACVPDSSRAMLWARGTPVNAFPIVFKLARAGRHSARPRGNRFPALASSPWALPSR